LFVRATCDARWEPGILTNQSGWPVVRVRFGTETFPSTNLRRAVLCNKHWKSFRECVEVRVACVGRVPTDVKKKGFCRTIASGFMA
jgi:hypothetical protein